MKNLSIIPADFACWRVKPLVTHSRRSGEDHGYKAVGLHVRIDLLKWLNHQIKN